MHILPHMMKNATSCWFFWSRAMYSLLEKPSRKLYVSLPTTHSRICFVNGKGKWPHCVMELTFLKSMHTLFYLSSFWHYDWRSPICVITLCNGVDLFEIYAHPYFSFLFLSNHDWRVWIGLLYWLYEPYIKEIFDLLFDQFGLLWIHVIRFLLDWLSVFYKGDCVLYYLGWYSL